MNKNIQFFFSAMLVVSFMMGIFADANAEDKGMYIADASILRVEGYPQVMVCPSYQFISEAPQAYYKVYGEWPESFASIVEAGLIRDNLTLDGESAISPDDGKFDGPSDVLYIFRGSQTPPQIAVQGASSLSVVSSYYSDSADSVNSLPDGSTAISLPSLDKMHVYANQSKEKSSKDGREGFNDSELRYGGNLEAHKLLAIAYMCMIGAVDYRSVNGKLPSNWDEFVDTGFCPVTSEMINPATGRPFSGDGTPYSFEFRVHENGSFIVGVHGDNGYYVKAW